MRGRLLGRATTTPGTHIFVALALAAMALYLADHGWKSITSLRARRAWPVTRGVMQQRRVGELYWNGHLKRARWNYDVYLSYRYVVDGQGYIGHRLRYERTNRESRDDMVRHLAPYNVGDSVTVHYDPADPITSVLELESTSEGVAWLILAPVLLVVAAFEGVIARNQLRSRRRRDMSVTPIGAPSGRPRFEGPRDPVLAAYDHISDQWLADRLAGSQEFREKRLIDRMLEPLRPGSTVLDVGCGGGRPITAYLVSRGFRVTGVDGSVRLLNRAKDAVAGASFILGDMRTVALGGPFGAVVAWDCVFHLPREQHADLFKRFHGWLAPKGRLLVSLGGSDDAGFTSQMHGQAFFYSGYDPSEALKVIEAAGFHVEHWEVDDPSGRGHIAVIAARP